MGLIRLWLVLCLMMVLVGCQASTSVPSSVARPEATSSQQAKPLSQLQDFFLNANALTINEYEVVKVRKTTALKGVREPVPVNVAVLKHQGTVLATFEGPSYPLGNSIDFALVPLLNRSQKELVISHLIPRGGRHWVVGFSPQPEVIFDSAEFQLGEEDFSFADLDQDGMAEIVLHTETFRGFEYLSMANSPHPEVIFKFDQSTKRYKISNKLFRNRYLEGIDKKQLHSDLTQRERYLADRLDIFLRYIYAGEEAQGWAFFDAAYQQNDDKALKAKIKARLANEPVYQMLNKQKVDR